LCDNGVLIHQQEHKMATPVSRTSLSPILPLARAASLICLGFLLLMVAGEMLNPHALPPSKAGDIVGLNLFPGMYDPGLLLAWWNELLGGSISLLGMLAFCVWLGVQDCSLQPATRLDFAAASSPGRLLQPAGLERAEHF
jgi:hypothetical protein